MPNITAFRDVTTKATTEAGWISLNSAHPPFWVGYDPLGILTLKR
jgi:hypothetical protein